MRHLEYSMNEPVREAAPLGLLRLAHSRGAIWSKLLNKVDAVPSIQSRTSVESADGRRIAILRVRDFADKT